MILNTFENTLRNCSFIGLFISMLFFWIKGSFFYLKKTNTFETILLIGCNLILVLLLLIRWIDSNHFPLSNLYESLIFLSWSLLSFLIFFQLKTKENFLGIILTPIILFINTFATFSLPTEMQKASSLVPALQSNWLMMHVTIMMLSYAALIFGSLLSLAFLISTYYLKINNDISANSKNLTKITPNSLAYTSLNFNKTESSTLITEYQRSRTDPSPEFSTSQNSSFRDKLDNLSYRTIGIGFPLLTIGILSGAVWANETWGSYWNWDPKETWALITWLIYSIYLHSRIVKGWVGYKPALIASLGFLAVWVCYLGVNLFGKGLHSYGWFSV